MTTLNATRKLMKITETDYGSLRRVSTESQLCASLHVTYSDLGVHMRSERPVSPALKERGQHRGARLGRSVYLRATAAALVASAGILPVITGCGISAGNKADLASALRPDYGASGSPSGLNQIFGTSCPDVMVMAARGSAEQPQAPKYDWTNPSAYLRVGPKNGLGAGLVNYDLFSRLTNADRKLKFSLDPIIYPANPVPSTPAGYVAYRASVRFGVKSLLADMQAIDSSCGAGNVHYIITGYSQGAWVVHDALHQMMPGQLREIAGVALFGDSDFVPLQPFVRAYKYFDLSLGLSAALDFANTSVPASVVSHTGSWCFPNDPVCQVIPNTALWAAEVALLVRNSRLSAHLSYVSGGETINAEGFLLPFLPKHSRF